MCWWGCACVRWCVFLFSKTGWPPAVLKKKKKKKKKLVTKGSTVVQWIIFVIKQSIMGKQHNSLNSLCGYEFTFFDTKRFFSIFFRSVFFSTLCGLFLKLAFESFLFFSVCRHRCRLHSLAPFHPHPHFITLVCTTGGGRRPEIDAGPVRTETGSWLNRSDRSGTEHLLCQTAGPLWMEIISKLLQEADACQKMHSVKVRLLQCCLAVSLSPPESHFVLFKWIYLFFFFIFHCFFLSCNGFSVI